MRKIYTIGETLVDIIFKQEKPVDAKAGGAMLNTSVSLGRLKMPVHFISEYADDPVGRIIEKFLIDNFVSTEFITIYKGQTALALAFLDEMNNADYTFYKSYPAERLRKPFPVIRENDIVLFGSFFAISPEIRLKVKQFIQTARDNNAIIIYDPNFRKSHLTELEKVKPMIIENIEFADIVRGSDEDFDLIFNASDAENSFEIIKKLNCSNLAYTTKENVFLHTSAGQQQFTVPDVKTVSTVGAGDNFNAGLIYSIIKNNISFKEINKIESSKWQNIIQTSIDFAINVCKSYDNYISNDFAEEILKITKD